VTVAVRRIERYLRKLAVVLVLILSTSADAAQDDGRAFAGVLVGVSTLSADGHAMTAAPNAAISLYKPENGIAINAFAGCHLARYVSLQGNYLWNRNDVTLISSLLTPQGGGFYEQERRSAQHAIVADTLLYFRPLGNAVRPYLGTGLSFVRFASRDIVYTVNAGLAAPATDIVETKLALRSHVGIDLRLGRGLTFRYSFSETISGNPLSPHLTPPAKRPLANFQNLFGFVAQF
jgi:Outer membrane protein beta-barrel domain